MSGQDAWARLECALAQAAARGCLPALWWRDDDAASDTTALRRLLALRREIGMPLAIAAIPAQADASLVACLNGEEDVALLVHGLAHANHAPPVEKKAEFGTTRPLPLAERDAAQALTLLGDKAGALVLPVFVPPWNRVSPQLRGRLASLGYRGLSAVPARDGADDAGLSVHDIHVDPIDWHGTRSALPAQAIVDKTIAWLARFAEGEARGALGFLTHHLVHDEAIWTASRRWLACWRDIGARRPSPRDLFCGGDGG